MFENVDGRTDGRTTDGRTTDGRTTDAGVTGILIAHLGAFGSGELTTTMLAQIYTMVGFAGGCKSKRPLVKTPPSQNVPELVKTSPNTKKRLVKTSP